MRCKPSSILILTLALLAGPACKRKKPVELSHAKSLVSTYDPFSLWPDPGRISVCWEEFRAEEHAEYGLQPQHLKQLEKWKREIQETVSSEFARADIKLIGWENCTSASRGLRLLLSDRLLPQVRAFGRELDGVYAGVKLSFCIAGSFGGKQRYCDSQLLPAAVHQFAHALGLRHERNRLENPYRPGPCLQEKATSGIAELFVTQIGDADEKSLLRDCAQMKAGKNERDHARLSEADVNQLKELYYGVLAAFRDVPPFFVSNRKSVSLHVAGRDIMQYRYAVGDPQQIDCRKEMAYSAARGIDLPIEVPAPGKGRVPMRVCVIGRNVEGRWQSFGNVSSVQWIFSETVPLLDLPPEGALLAEPRLTIKPDPVLVTGSFYYKLAAVEDAACSQIEGYMPFAPGTAPRVHELQEFGPAVNLCVTAVLSDPLLPEVYSWRVQPQVSLDYEPRAELSTIQNIGITASAGTEQYRFKLGDATLDCRQEQGYAEAQSILVPLALDAKKFHSLCLVGASAGRWQDFANATRVSW